MFVWQSLITYICVIVKLSWHSSSPIPASSSKEQVTVVHFQHLFANQPFFRRIVFFFIFLALFALRWTDSDRDCDASDFHLEDVFHTIMYFLPVPVSSISIVLLVIIYLHKIILTYYGKKKLPNRDLMYNTYTGTLLHEILRKANKNKEPLQHEPLAAAISFFSSP